MEDEKLPTFAECEEKDVFENTMEALPSCLGLKTEAGRLALILALENIQLLDRKQQDYGPKNVSGFGVFGVVVRMTDKFERLKTMFNKKRKRMVNESMRDSFRDISNYAIIALLVESGKWPKE